MGVCRTQNATHANIQSGITCAGSIGHLGGDKNDGAVIAPGLTQKIGDFNKPNLRQPNVLSSNSKYLRPVMLILPWLRLLFSKYLSNGTCCPRRMTTAS